MKYYLFCLCIDNIEKYVTICVNGVISEINNNAFLVKDNNYESFSKGAGKWL